MGYLHGQKFDPKIPFHELPVEEQNRIEDLRHKAREKELIAQMEFKEKLKEHEEFIEQNKAYL